MDMDLDPDIYERLKAIDCFARAGHRLTEKFEFAVVAATGLSEAMTEIRSDRWQDARTEAQGDSTGHLSKDDYDLHGGNRNRLAKASRQRIRAEIMPDVSKALAKLTTEPVSDSVLLELNRIAMHAAFRKKCRSFSSFFDRLMSIYTAGPLSCSWTGDFESWPVGKFVID